MSERTKRIAGCILLLIFTTYFVNITFFTHSHTINGATIVHSHFHTKDHTQTGSHSESEITLISELSVFQSFVVTLGFTALGIFFFLQAIIRPFLTDRIIPKTIACISLRAPPSSIN